MKLLKKDFKHETKIKPENADDLWNLKSILVAGDIVGARTVRTIQASDKGEKKPVYLKLRVEKVSFDEEGARLRVHGKIVAGPDDVQFGYHSFLVDVNTVISVEKEWRASDVLLLNESLKCRGSRVLICVMDDRRADFAIATDVKIVNKGSVSAKSAGKLYGGESPSVYYDEVIAYLLENMELCEKIIVAGPGFTKDNLYARVRDAGLKAKVVLEVSSVTGKTGINEVVKRGGLERVMKESRISSETEKVELFLSEIAKDSRLVTYGRKQVIDAVGCGAVSLVLVSDKLVRDADIERMIGDEKRQKGEVMIVNSTHEAGEKLYALGGVAAFLRFKV